MTPKPQAITFSFPIVKIENGLYTDPDVFIEWMATLLGDTLKDIPGSYLGVESIKEDDYKYGLFRSTISELDLVRLDGIFAEMEELYSQFWDDPTFHAYNFSEEGFIDYEYRVHNGHLTLIGYTEPK